MTSLRNDPMMAELCFSFIPKTLLFGFLTDTGLPVALLMLMHLVVHSTSQFDAKQYITLFAPVDLDADSTV